MNIEASGHAPNIENDVIINVIIIQHYSGANFTWFKVQTDTVPA